MCTTIKKFWVSKLKHYNTFILKGCIKLIKSDGKDFYIVQKWKNNEIKWYINLKLEKEGLDL